MVPAHSLLFSKSTKGAARLNVPPTDVCMYVYIYIYIKLDTYVATCFGGRIFTLYTGRG